MSEIPAVDEKQFRKILQELGDSAHVRNVFGEAVISGDRALIPVARIHHMGGGGYGGGAGTESECGPECPPDCTEDHTQEGYGSGMGLGYSVTAEPVGVIEVTEDGLIWNPTIDWNRLAYIGAVVSGVIAVVAMIGSAFTGDD